MIQLRVIKRIEPTTENFFVIQKIKRCGFLFFKKDWKDCDALDLTFNDGNIHGVIGLGTNRFSCEKEARDHFCYFDGSKSVDIILPTT